MSYDGREPFIFHLCVKYFIKWSRAVMINQLESIQLANRLIDSKLLNQFTETIHYLYLFNGIVARKCQQIDFYLT